MKFPLLKIIIMMIIIIIVIIITIIIFIIVVMIVAINITWKHPLAWNVNKWAHRAKT